MATANQIAPGLPGGADPAMVGVGNQNPNRPGAAQVPAPQVPVVPKTPIAPAVSPIVSTSAPAIQDVQNKMAVVNNLASAQKGTPQITLYGPNGAMQSVREGDSNYQDYVSRGWSPTPGGFGQPPARQTPAVTNGQPLPTNLPPLQQGQSGQLPGMVPLPNAPEAPDTLGLVEQNIGEFRNAMAEANNKSDLAFQDYQNNVNQIRNGTFALSPDQQALIDGITNRFQSLIADQKIANRNYEGAVKQAGISAGRNMYAPEIELGNVNAAVASGARAIADIDAKMSSSIAEAKLAFQESNFKMLDAAYSRMESYLSDKKKTISDTYDKVKDALDSAQQKFQNDMATADFNFKVATELNKPILEADKQMKDYLYSEMQKYPDAGIDAKDTVQSAVDKIKASKTYLNEQESIRLDQEAQKASIEASRASAASSRASAARAMAEINALTAPAGTNSFVQDAASGIAINLPKAQAEEFMKKVNSAVESGDAKRVQEALRQGVRASLDTEAKRQYDGRFMAIQSLTKLEQAINDYTKAGGQTGLLKGNAVSVATKLGQVADPKLQAIAQRASLALNDYRKAMTGAVFTKQEMQQYEALFPTEKGKAELATNKIQTLKDVFNENNASALGAVIGRDAYDAVYGSQNMTPTSQNNLFSIQAGGKTYSFPDQAALDQFKKDANL